MTETQEVTLAERAVKAAAMDASPSLSIGPSISRRLSSRLSARAWVWVRGRVRVEVGVRV